MKGNLRNSTFLMGAIIAATLVVVVVMILMFNVNHSELQAEPVNVEQNQVQVQMPELTEEAFKLFYEEYLALYSPYGIEPRGSFPLSDSDRHYIECIVAGESGGEPYKGQIAVAECIRNGLEAGGINYTPQQLRRDAGYSGWKDNPEEYPGVKEAVEAVFDRGVRTTVEKIRWFYAPSLVQSEWHEATLQFVEEIGGHRFFCEKGGE